MDEKLEAQIVATLDKLTYLTTKIYIPIMCSTSKVNEALKGVTSSSSSNNSATAIPAMISAHKIRQNRSHYLLVDVREDAEIQETPFADADAKVTLGVLCHDASDLLAQGAAAAAAGTDENKTVVLVCGTGRRATIAAQSMVANPRHSGTAAATHVAVLQRGLLGWNTMAAISPDFLVVLGLNDSTEKLSLSLAAAAAAVDTHETVVLVLMSDGVNWFVKTDSPKKASDAQNVESVSHGAPFKPCKAMLNKFLTNGGVVLGCGSCVKHRGCSFETDMMDCVHPMQMPDLVRMIGEAKGGCLQFV